MTSSDKPANPLRGNDWNTSGPSLDLPADDDSLRVAAASQRALIRVLATAQRYRIPPSDLVDRLSHEFPGHEGKAMGQVAQLLAAGVPVIDALEQTPTVLDPVRLM